MKQSFHFSSLAETREFGLALGKSAQRGDVVFLRGDLGAGKTTLTQFIAEGLEVTDNYVTSPSFSLMNQYFGRLPLYHIDCYRLEDEDDVEGSGIIDYIVADGLTVIEWPDRLGSLTPEKRLDIVITSGLGEERTYNITAHGAGWEKMLRSLQDAFV